MGKKETQTKIKVDINESLLAINFTIFALIVSLNPSLLKQPSLVIQLTAAIPLLLSSTFARSKLIYAKKPDVWENYGYLTFLFGYTFLINVFGVLLSKIFDVKYGLFFLLFNIIIAVIYSACEVIEDKTKLRIRIMKDALFTAIVFFGGILPSFNLY